MRDSEIYTLGEVSKFRVVGMNDLGEFAYNGDRSRMENDVESLARQGLLTQTTIADSEHNPTPVVALTKEGHKLLSRGKWFPQVKPPTTDSKSPKKLSTMPISIGSITRSTMKSKAAAAKSYVFNSIMK